MPRLTRDSIFHELGHCFVAAHYGRPAGQFDIYATLSESQFVLPEGKQCLIHVHSIYAPSDRALPGWEKPAFAIALGGEMIERIYRGQSLDWIIENEHTNVADFFEGSLHQNDYTKANYLLAHVPGDAATIARECITEVFNVLSPALSDIAAEANRIEGWVSEAWLSGKESGACSLVPTPRSHWIAKSFVSGRSGLHVCLATDFPKT
jgi:hypothetical protein